MRFGPKTIGAAALALAAGLFFSLPASTQVNIGSVVLRAGSAIIGAVTINQTTPGVTNGVVLAPSNAAGAGFANLSSAAAEASHVICSAVCNVYDFTVTTGAAAGFLILWNDTAAPANGAIAGGGGATSWSKCIQAAANTTIAVDYTKMPLRMSTGAVLLYSTTGCYTYTASATAAYDWRVKQ